MVESESDGQQDVPSSSLNHETTDPVPPTQSATESEINAYAVALGKHVSEWCELQTEVGAPAESIWADFTADFCEYGIRHLTSGDTVRLRGILQKRGVFVRASRGYSRTKALVECWNEEKCPLDSNKGSFTQHNEACGRSPRTTRELPQQNGSNVLSENRVDDVNAGSRDRERSFEVQDETNLMRRVVAVDGNVQMVGNPPSYHDRGSNYEKNSALQSLMKAFGSRKKYTGAWDEDLSGTIEVFEMSANMCNLTMEQKLKGVPVMLDGPALSYYASNLKSCKTYDSAIEGLKIWYTSEEQRSRLLREWQTTCFSVWCRRIPTKSEVTVFRDMSSELSKIQRQLHYKYHNDIFLRDRLVASADLPQLSRALKEKPPKTAHEARERIASLLSSEPNSAGSVATAGDDAYWGTDRRYHGQAERKIPMPFRKEQKGGYHRNREKRRLAKVKGCWVCGRNHQAREYHPRDQVEAALKRHKESGAYVSAESAYDALLIHSDDEEHVDESDTEESEDDAAAMVANEVYDVNKSLERKLANTAFMSTCGFFQRRKVEMEKMECDLSITDREVEFNDIMINTGCNRKSLMTLRQYQAYCREHGVPGRFNKCARTVNGIGGGVRTVGVTIISIPFPTFGMNCDVEFNITLESHPTLLSLNDLKRTGIDISVQRNVLLYGNKEHKLVLENGLLFYRWHPDIALYTYGELLKLHRAFGHPSVSSLYNVLKRARPDETPSGVRNAIQEIQERCQTCQELGRRPKRFKLTVGNDDSRFNHVVAVDIFYIDNSPVLHLVDEETHFNAATFLRNVSTKEVWRSLKRCWIHSYLGPPDFLRIDQGSQFTSREFKGELDTWGIKSIDAPIESPSTMSHVERYHGPLRVTYKKLESDLKGEPKADILQMAVHCVNATTGPEGICPTMCVFGSIPRPLRKTTTPDQLTRSRAIDKAMEVVQREQTKRRVSFGLGYRGPYGKERLDLDQLQFGAPVRVFRETTKKWEGPYKFVNKFGETVTVQLPQGRRIFRSHVVRPVKNTDDIKLDSVVGLPSSVHATASASTGVDLSHYALRDTMGSMNYSLHISENTKEIEFARKRELVGLTKAGVFQIVNRSTVPKGKRIYGTRWVDTIKQNTDGSNRYKSRLVSQNFRDYDARHIPTKAPTISRFGQRLALTISAMHSDGQANVRDVTQAYVQSKTDLGRDIFLQPPTEMHLLNGKVLLAVKPLYGVPESGLHWFLTYHDHHTGTLGMTACQFDNCILYRRTTDSKSRSTLIPDLVIIQVDDSYGIGSGSFLELEERASRAFKSKPRQLLAVGGSVQFNGCCITRKECSVYAMNQTTKIASLSDAFNDQLASSERGKMQYIATATRPDIASATQLLTADATNASLTTLKRLKDVVHRLKATREMGLRFVKLDPETLRLVLFTDASFANSDNLSSQMGFVIVIADGQNNANILHYGSKKCSRVTRSVMAAELLALVNGFDHAFVIQHTLQELFGRTISIDAFVDSRTTFNCVAKQAGTTESRLQIDAAAIRQSYDRGELRCFGWIPGKENPADGLTKSSLPTNDHPLVHMMRTNKLTLNPQG